MATPSLVMIPSGYKSEKVYSVLPSNGDGDFTFYRGSDAVRVNKDGLIEVINSNVPRLDYSDGSCPSLFLEPQSTNLVISSQDFSHATWLKFGGSTVSSNEITSPDGSLNATKITRGTTLLSLRARNLIQLGDTYIFSIYVKKGSTDLVKLDIADQSQQQFSMTDEWQRIEMTVTSGNSDDWVDINFHGNSNEGDYFYIWGAQVEEQTINSSSTSYIPTNGTIATRLAETCTDAGNSDTFNSEEGALFYEALFGEEYSDSRYISISDSSSSNRVIIGVTGGSNVLRAFVFSGGVEQAQIIETIDLSQTIKVCISYKQNEIKFYKNGFLVGEDTSSITPVGLSELALNAYPSSANFYGKVKEVRVYNEALTDAELQELTS